MPEKVKLWPAQGLVVRDPVTGEPLPPGGAVKTLDTYWRRRLRDGDAVRVDPAAPARTPAQPKAKAEPKAKED